MKTTEQIEYDEYCKFEDGLINNRLGWLLASESLLFAGYAAIVSSDKLTDEHVVRLTTPLLIVGITVAVLIFLSILAAVLANVHNWHKLNKPDQKVSLGVYPPSTTTAWVATCLIPLTFATGWILIWIKMCA
jgi:hypothetical protein